MGQKVNPKGFRLGPLNTWSSRWFADDKQYKFLLLSDIKLRKLLTERLRTAGLALVELERSINKIKITLHVSRPGVVIGRGGSGLEELKKTIVAFFAKDAKTQNVDNKADSGKLKIEISVEPVKEPNLNAYLVATNVADQIARRLPHKRVCLQAVDRMIGAGAAGAKILLAGRVGGAEIARKEKYQQGSVPLSTIREDVDFAAVPSLTKSGYVGVKVWIYRKGKV
jgi:small subunit ribosomal protein S3